MLELSYSPNTDVWFSTVRTLAGRTSIHPSIYTYIVVQKAIILFIFNASAERHNTCSRVRCVRERVKSGEQTTSPGQWFKAYKIYLLGGRKIPMHYNRAREGADEKVRPVIWQRFSYYWKRGNFRPLASDCISVAPSCIARSSFLSTGWWKFSSYNRPLTLLLFPCCFFFAVCCSLFLTLGGSGCWLGATKFGCLGAYDLRWVFKVKEKVARSVVDSCR
jgi:hypothetical protein